MNAFVNRSLISYLTKFLRRFNSDVFIRKQLSILRNLKILDIGAGYNDYSRFIDSSNSLIIADTVKVGRVNCIADINKMPFPDETFDYVICNNVLEHVTNPFSAVKELKRVLKRGGTLIVGVPFMFPEHMVPEDYWRFTTYGLKELFKEYELIDSYSTQVLFIKLGILIVVKKHGAE